MLSREPSFENICVGGYQYRHAASGLLKERQEIGIAELNSVKC